MTFSSHAAAQDRTERSRLDSEQIAHVARVAAVVCPKAARDRSPHTYLYKQVAEHYWNEAEAATLFALCAIYDRGVTDAGNKTKGY